MAISYADAKIEVEGLMERFARNLDVYKRADYKETQVRIEFIDPFFEALGWDVRNVQGYAEQYKDVIHEDAIKVGGATRAPDYCFRIGGVRKFFLEAKKPSISVKGDVGPAYQLRRYAWSAKLPLSILTDFEEFSVYDCRQRPKPADKASAGRVMYLTFDQYLDRFDDIHSVFAKESVLKGSFDRYVQDARRKRGTSEVDAEFLKEIEGWRDTLARNIALRNPALSVPELNFAVQRTIDRLIFLRMCEDRGIEDYARLLALTSGPHIYERLGDLYRQADEKYNSDLFDFQADTLTKTLSIDDKVLKPILAGLYYPQSPYEFSVLPAEILGQVYEQFLGKVIRLTPGHRAKVEEKPEVKKAGGVYYTPTYIVDYIVKQTVGRLVEGKTPRQISKLRILDPACGSGSFLLGAYQYLLDYHRQWYEAHDPAKHARGKRPALYQGPRGDWRLTSAEKKRILLNNIYGVDIDRQAVEVTKLSLLLKVLEGENQETLGQQLALWRERALPDLGNNIKCGNSLIGPDYFEAQLLPDEEEMRRVNPFDWEAEFTEAMAAGGFDAVIGNPPWGAALDNKLRECLSERFPQVADYESSQYFLMKAIKLTKPNGAIGYIIPNTFALNVYARKCRKAVLSLASVTTLCDLSRVDVFAGPSVRSMVMILQRTQTTNCHIVEFRQSGREVKEVRTVEIETLRTAETWSQYLIPPSPLGILVNRLQETLPTLDDYCEVRQGYIPYRTTTLTRRFGEAQAKKIVKGRLWHADEKLGPDYVKELQGKDVGLYFLQWSGVWVRYGEWVSTYLPPRVFSGPRVLIREITGHLPRVLLATYAEEVFVHNPSVVAVLPRPQSPHPKFVLGVLNSRAMSAFFLQVAPKARKGLFPKIIITDARRLPVPLLDLSDPTDQARHDKMVALVERMLALHKKLAAATIPADKELYQRQIEATDRQIDALVYELYGLTEEEIGVVEGLDH